MPVFRRSIQIDAPLARVWTFHTRIDGLLALTPEFLHLQVDTITHRDGEPDPEDLDAGTVVALSIRPFDLGPRHRATVEIVDRQREPGHAVFVDELVDGPLPYWQHTHRFYGDDTRTTLIDRIEYAFPDPGAIPIPDTVVHDLGDLPFKAGLALAFRQRHRQVRRRLENFSASKPNA